MHILDNPIWEALISDQRALATGDALARRFPPDIGPLVGMVDQSEAAYTALAQLGKPGEQLVLFLPAPPMIPEGWSLDVGGELTQMVFEGEADPSAQALVDPLSEADVAEMIALTRLTNPGPFRQRTIELGGYCGIHDGGRLAAMAGKRLSMPGFTEISAVCTHPDFQGKGYAQTLLKAVACSISRQGKTPFLHTRPDNTRAIQVYEKLGFRTRRLLHLAVVRHEAMVATGESITF